MNTLMPFWTLQPLLSTTKSFFAHGDTRLSIPLPLCRICKLLALLAIFLVAFCLSCYMCPLFCCGSIINWSPLSFNGRIPCGTLVRSSSLADPYIVFIALTNLSKSPSRLNKAIAIAICPTSVVCIYNRLSNDIFFGFFFDMSVQEEVKRWFELVIFVLQNVILSQLNYPLKIFAWISI